jgi:hypothetical protein
MTTELESWFHPDAGGTAWAVLGTAGVRHELVFAQLSGGANLFNVDNLDDESAVGVLSPRGGAALGVAIGTFRLAATADAQWRWRFGAPSVPLFQIGGIAGFAWESSVD